MYELGLLIISLLIALCSSPVASASNTELPPPLTPSNFASTIEKGIWCIEFTSRYCGHCRRFAPTWAKLVAQNERGEHGNWAQGHRGPRLAQVDCSTHGDLCSQMKVEGYPTLFLYRDGKQEDQFKGERSLERLGNWLRKWRDEDDSDSSKAVVGQPTFTSKQEGNPNPNGEVLKLSSATFTSSLGSLTSPVFIKFCALWSGHCSRLAPTWRFLAKHMQNRLTIAEVNCDEDRALCEQQGILGYPALMLYAAGGESKSEYTGSRKFEKMSEWLQRASAEPTKPIQAGDLQNMLQESPQSVMNAP